MSRRRSAVPRGLTDPEVDGEPRAQRQRKSTKASRPERFSIVTWNVTSLRTLLRREDGVEALKRILRENPLMVCLIEHKLQAAPHESSMQVREHLERLAIALGYGATWTFSSRAGSDGLVLLASHSARFVRAPFEPTLQSEDDACNHERRLLCCELESLSVLFADVPNSSTPTSPRRSLRLDNWEPSVRRLLLGLKAPVLYQGDLNVAHQRVLDCYKEDPQGCTASGRTREEMAAMDTLLKECELVDGFRHCHPTERSATCWATKKAGDAEPRQYWKRYDYALVSRVLAADGRASQGAASHGAASHGAASQGAARGLRLVDVRHLGDTFEGGQPDHVPVESVFEGYPPHDPAEVSG